VGKALSSYSVSLSGQLSRSDAKRGLSEGHPVPSIRDRNRGYVRLVHL